MGVGCFEFIPVEEQAQKMFASSTDNATVAKGYTTRRTGPVGRLARLILVGVFSLSLASIVDSRGSAHFRNPHILHEPLAWLLHLVLFVVFINLVGILAATLSTPVARRRWQVAVFLASLLVVALAGEVGRVTHGAFWGFPLADLVWWFDVLVLIEQIAATLLAIALGTPGCEIGVWAELMARKRREVAAPEQGLACVVGLHLIDAWEESRRIR